MKKILVIGMTLATVFCANALTFRQSAAYYKGLNTTTDTLTITPQERIMAMHMVLCARAARGTSGNSKADYTNNVQFTDAQFVEWYTRGMNSGMQGYVMSQMLGSSNVDTYGVAATDAQLETSYKNVMFGVIKIIGTGSL
jgi:hypothetical protein